MEVEKVHKVDRTGWPAGPWDEEEDKLLWQHCGYACMIVRNQLGALCGYVGVPEGHPWYGKEYDSIAPYPDVHCGLTYSAFCQEEGGAICHPSPEKLWWLGFDCAHGGDQIPGMMVHAKLSPVGIIGTYRDVEYVGKDVESLAEEAVLAKK